MTQITLEVENDKIAQVIAFAKDLKLAFHADDYPNVSFDEAKAEVAEILSSHKAGKGGFLGTKSVFDEAHI